ncbi:hypothetical protein ACA910_014275 [Epithemia clementina (nom. ined.)]
MRVQSLRHLRLHQLSPTATEIKRKSAVVVGCARDWKPSAFGFRGDRPSYSCIGAMSQIPVTRGYSSSSSALQGSPSSSYDFAAFASNLIKFPVEAAFPAICLLSILAGAAYWVHRGEIQRRWLLLTEESWIFGAGITMDRVPSKEGGSTDGSKEMTAFQNLKLLQLNPEFQAKCAADGWNVYSLGDYMSTLRPKQLPKDWSMDKVPSILQREIEAGLAAALLKTLGPSLARALLPVTSLGAIQRRAQSLAANVATNWFLSEETGSLSKDKGGIPVSLMTLLAASDLNARINSGKSPIIWVTWLAFPI